MKITEEKTEDNFCQKNMNIDEIIKLLVEVRVDLTSLMGYVSDKEVKKELKWAINGIDIIGCELTQNIAKKLKEK
ncbi:MAG: hypothetical protein ACTSR5_17255 [Promethearchaeota archaeon]